MPATIDGDTYKYFMSVIDIFSRFVFLSPLQTKESAEVAEHLLDIYNEHGPPRNSPERPRNRVGRCASPNVPMMKNAAYSP